MFDYDLTTDIKGCIDKQKFIKYLMLNHGFTLGQGQRHSGKVQDTVKLCGHPQLRVDGFLVNRGNHVQC